MYDKQDLMEVELQIKLKTNSMQILMYENFLLENVDKDRVKIPVVIIIITHLLINKLNNILESYIQVDKYKDPNKTYQFYKFPAFYNHT